MSDKTLDRPKRSQVRIACTACRTSKAGCSDQRPCTRCSSLNIQCVDAPRRRPRGSKLIELERVVKKLMAHNQRMKRRGADDDLSGDEDDSLASGSDDDTNDGNDDDDDGSSAIADAFAIDDSPPRTGRHSMGARSTSTTTTTTTSSNNNKTGSNGVTTSSTATASSASLKSSADYAGLTTARSVLDDIHRHPPASGLSVARPDTRKGSSLSADSAAADVAATESGKRRASSRSAARSTKSASSSSRSSLLSPSIDGIASSASLDPAMSRPPKRARLEARDPLPVLQPHRLLEPSITFQPPQHFGTAYQTTAPGAMHPTPYSPASHSDLDGPSAASSSAAFAHKLSSVSSSGNVSLSSSSSNSHPLDYSMQPTASLGNCTMDLGHESDGLCNDAAECLPMGEASLPRDSQQDILLMRISHLETTRACTLSEISDLKREISSLHSIIQTMSAEITNLRRQIFHHTINGHPPQASPPPQSSSFSPLFFGQPHAHYSARQTTPPPTSTSHSSPSQHQHPHPHPHQHQPLLLQPHHHHQQQPQQPQSSQSPQHSSHIQAPSPQLASQSLLLQPATNSQPIASSSPSLCQALTGLSQWEIQQSIRRNRYQFDFPNDPVRVPCSVWQLNPDDSSGGWMTDCNDAFCSFARSSKHDMLGKRLYFRSLVPPQQAYRANHIVHFIFTKSVESMMMYHKWTLANQDINLLVQHYISYDFAGEVHKVELRVIEAMCEDRELFRPFQIVWRPGHPTATARESLRLLGGALDEAFVDLEGPNELDSPSTSVQGTMVSQYYPSSLSNSMRDNPAITLAGGAVVVTHQQQQPPSLR